MRSLRILGLICLTGATLAPGSAFTAPEPYLAIRTGFKCSQCHSNRTGGGKRNDFGNIFAQTRLPLMVAGVAGDSRFARPQLTEFFSLGVDVRISSSREVTGAQPMNGFDIDAGNLYLEARVIPDVLSVYLDEALAPGSPRNRELFLLIEGLPADSYIKVGQFFLPYGLRLLDDDEFIRQRSGFSFDNSDRGIEIGLEPGRLSLAVALSNGTQGAAENNSDKQLSGLVSFVFDRVRVGASASHNNAPLGKRDILGMFGGFRLGRFTLLGEFDYIFDEPPEGRRGDQFAAFLEGDFLVRRGVNMKVTYGFLDPDRQIGENARTRLRFGIEPFVTQFLQLAVFYTIVEDIPQAKTDRDKLTVELHGFF